MKTVHKYPLKLQAEQSVAIPRGGKILSAQLQGDTICVWVEVDDTTEKRQHVTFIVVGTGCEVPTYANHHIATVQMGPMVWHLYADFLP